MIVVLFFVLGSCFGSFFCLVIERTEQKKSIIYPGSACGNCGHPLQFYEMIPAISILLQKFRCRKCHCRIPVTYFLAEVCFGCLGVWLFFQTINFQTLFSFIWLLQGMLLSLTDLFFYHVEPKILYPTTALMLIISLETQQPIYWLNLFILALLFYVLLRLIPDGFGGGDVQLLLCWSLFLSVFQIGQLIFIACSLGILAYLFMHFSSTSKKKLPFVPFLLAALVIVLLLT